MIEMENSLIGMKVRITKYPFHLFFQTFCLMLKDRPFINCIFVGFFLAEFQTTQPLKRQEEANGKCSSPLALMLSISVSELTALCVSCCFYLF